MKTLPVIQNPIPPSAKLGPTQTEQIRPDTERTAALRPSIVAALSRVFDPEIPVNIYDLDLVYDIVVDRASIVGIRMTLTAPACPVAGALAVEVERQVRQVPGVSDVKVDIVWDPPWDRARMSEAARLELGLL